MDEKRLVNGKLLRCGHTTGTCAAAAARAAATAFITGHFPESVTVVTPKGAAVTVKVECASLTRDGAKCAVQKDGGDDPDITNGLLVYAAVSRTESGVLIDGGEGIGRVTMPGLDQPVGSAAINSVPREMITREVREVIRSTGYNGGLSIIISIPGGEERAQRTFNPRLGIQGGLSILGTSGIVEPMSEAALISSIKAELSVLRSSGEESLLVSPGNYGVDFAKNDLGIDTSKLVKCSNFVGETLETAAEMGFRRILLIGHIGKLVKLGIGASNTHSRHGDGRLETLITCALAAGAEISTLRGISRCATTEAALYALDCAGILERTMAELSSRISDTLARRVLPETEIAFIAFAKGDMAGIVTESGNARALANAWRK